jgi:hypothetical protein
MTAYLDNNIIVDIEKGSLLISDLNKLTERNISKFYYSMSHIFEANEITASSNRELNERLSNRFKIITKITGNNYLERVLPSNKVIKTEYEPFHIYQSINEVSFARNSMKQMVNNTSEEDKKKFREQLNIDPLRINNYSPQEAIAQIDSNKIAMGGFTLLELIEKGIEMHPDGKNMSLHNRFAGVFEILDLVGFWKDKYNEKSNYARLWDSSHAYFSTFCDYFISDDKRTRNKTKLVFELYDIDTKVISSKGEE